MQEILNPMRRVQMYRILCDRTPARELGSGLTWLKKDGKIVEYSTTEEAGAKAKELNEVSNTARITTTNVKYSAKEYDTRGGE
jgi:hypothetical protein